MGSVECASYAAKSGDIGTAVNAALSVGLPDTERDLVSVCVREYLNVGLVRLIAFWSIEALRFLNDAPFELMEH